MAQPAKRKTVNYKLGKIYEIIDMRNMTTIYVGSTCQTLAQRMSAHRALASKPGVWNQVIHLTMNAGGRENYHIALIELFPCKSKGELQAREYRWIRQKAPACNHHGNPESAKKLIECECGSKITACHYRMHYFHCKHHNPDDDADHYVSIRYLFAPAMSYKTFKFP